MKIKQLQRFLKQNGIKTTPRTNRDVWLAIMSLATTRLEENSNKKIKSITSKGLKSKDPYIVMLAEAVNLQLLNEEPVISKKDEIGYEVANWIADAKTKKDPLYIQLTKLFDESQFVFNHTKYDTYESGNYYRMS